jgi:pyridoxine kinase
MRGARIITPNFTDVLRDRGEGTSTVLAYDRRDVRFWKVDCAYIPAGYPGTADAFASLASKASFGYGFPPREGVLLERVLDALKAPLASMTSEIFER